MQAIIALGANLGDRRKTIEKAYLKIEEQIGQITARSNLIETKAIILDGEDPALHPDFLNGVVLSETKLNPEEILIKLKEIELGCGRKENFSGKKWQPRELDLDLIALGACIVSTNNLSLPHPEFTQRLFVLEPLCQIAPDWAHPVSGLTAKELLSKIK